MNLKPKNKGLGALLLKSLGLSLCEKSKYSDSEAEFKKALNIGLEEEIFELSPIPIKEIQTRIYEPLFYFTLGRLYEVMDKASRESRFTRIRTKR